MQYQFECLAALKSVVNIQKPFEKTFMDVMKLFMAIPDRINFLQLGRYGRFSEQTYRNLFEHETFDWFAFNGSIISKYLTGKRKAIAIDPSYIPKSSKKTPWIGYFWSGCAGKYKRGQGKAIRIESICKSSQKVCFLGHLVSDGRKDRQVATLFLYRRFHGWTRGAG